MNRSNYIHPLQDTIFQDYKEGIAFQEDIKNEYEEIEYKMRLPDLLGKTVKVGPHQFPNVLRIMSELTNNTPIDSIPVHVYEEYYYEAESYGVDNPWIELSAKTITDFSDEELKFMLAREVYKITDGVTKQKTLMNERFKYLKSINSNAEDISKLRFYHWYRLANYSADNYAYLFCGSIIASVNAILKTVLNSVSLAEQVNINEFIQQASEINLLDDTSSIFTKLDEPVPYAPLRIQNLFAYSLSERGLTSIKERMVC